MKYAFYPGCVARGGAPELYDSAIAVMDRLGIEHVELTKAACTGAGVLQEKNLKMGDILNVRTFAMAEQMGLQAAMVGGGVVTGIVFVLMLRRYASMVAALEQRDGRG